MSSKIYIYIHSNGPDQQLSASFFVYATHHYQCSIYKFYMNSFYQEWIYFMIYKYGSIAKLSYRLIANKPSVLLK